MALSTISLDQVLNVICAKGIPDPRVQPSGYGDDLALELGNETMADLLTERFNWKFNRGVARPIYTNTWQQDYPQPAQAAGIIGWGEDCDIVDINNTVFPKPLNWDGAITWKRQLTRTSQTRWRPSNICWMYNADLSYGTWPGSGVIFHPLLGNNAPAGQNPIMSMIDANGNYLILTTFGTTGSAQPMAVAAAPEGTVVADGSCAWTVVSGTSQGFRLDWLPNATGPTYQILPYYQIDPPKFSATTGLLTPIPDSFSRHFFTGMEAACFKASPNPGDKARGQIAKIDWLNALELMIKQGNREPDAYGMIPATSVVERRWGNEGMRTADQPFG
jgi:hypothetical protein